METILVTGSASGFGKCIALYFAQKGAKVFATMRGLESRNRDAANELRAYSDEVQGQIIPLELDVTCQQSINKVAEYVSEEGLDCLVNNAGVGALGLVEEFSLEAVRKVFEVNVFAPLQVSKAMLPILQLSDNPLIVNISSSGGRLCFPFLGVYGASKFALEGLTESWSQETQFLGVEQCLIEPGAFPTNLDDKRMRTDVDMSARYGQLTKAPSLAVQRMAVALDTAPPSLTEIPKAIEKLIKMPVGKRPVRTVVGDIMTHGIDDLNQLQQQMQDQLTGAFSK